MQWLKDNRNGLSLAALAKGLNRSLKAVRQKIKHLDMPPKRNPHFWSKAEDQQLKELFDKKLSIQEIAAEMKRSIASIRIRANKTLGAFRSDRHLQQYFRGENFYMALKGAFGRGSAKAKCCLCDYDRYVELHHIDGNRDNNHRSNIASVCPTHHVEITHGDHENAELYCIWWRVYSDGTKSRMFTNRPNDSNHSQEPRT